MARKLGLILLSLIGFAAAIEPVQIDHIRRSLDLRKTIARRDLTPRDVDPSTLYPEYNLSVPIDHFHNDSQYAPHSNGKFNLRYWFDASHYKPGGPVIVLQSGETSGVGRLTFLQKGLLAQLAKATNGIGVVLEHRYYGTSWPVPDLSTKNMRFLTTDQALADEAYFAKNVVFKGLEKYDLKAPKTAYIGYGGSYAGAFNAFLRKLYPDVFWGTISSSGVTEAVWDYWKYYEPHRVYGPPVCISNTQKLTNVLDTILIQNKKYTPTLKNAFGLANLTHDADFAYLLSYGVQYWQSKNWDPALNDPTFDEYCGNISSTKLLYPATKSLTPTVETLIKAGGWSKELSTLTNPMLNYIGWMNLSFVSSCTTPNQDSCFTNYNVTYYEQDSLDDDWRSWPFQYCQTWGFLQTGSGVPKTQLPLVSRLIDLEFNSLVCKYAFGITTPPNVNAVNKYGGYGISYPRLAIIDGEQDPWRPVTPHASPFVAGVKNRTSTTSEPFLLIDGAVHHWDENGLFKNETTASLPPQPVKQVQAQELTFVLAWMEEWKKECERRKRWFW